MAQKPLPLAQCVSQGMDAHPDCAGILQSLAYVAGAFPPLQLSPA